MTSDDRCYYRARGTRAGVTGADSSDGPFDISGPSNISGPLLLGCAVAIDYLITAAHCY
jgi:hypothetical protein